MFIKVNVNWSNNTCAAKNIRALDIVQEPIGAIGRVGPVQRREIGRSCAHSGTEISFKQPNALPRETVDSSPGRGALAEAPLEFNNSFVVTFGF